MADGNPGRSNGVKGVAKGRAPSLVGDGAVVWVARCEPLFEAAAKDLEPAQGREGRRQRVDRASRRRKEGTHATSIWLVSPAYVARKYWQRSWMLPSGPFGVPST